MKAVRVQYTVADDCIEQNKKNIKAVMDSLKENPIKGMYYATFQLSDGKSFMHLNFAEDGETMSKLNDVEAFQNFRNSLKASGPISPPKAENIELVGMGYEVK